MRLLLAFLLTLFGLSANAQSSQGAHTCAVDGVAVGGYDLVSYHLPDGPLMGSPEFAETYEGLVYHFNSETNKKAFLEAPKKYLPTYQGWCAATLAMGRLACPDYTNFKIENGRLLLFELAGFTNGRSLWNTDPTGFRERADANFKTLVK